MPEPDATTHRLHDQSQRLILLTGATGYVGGRLRAELEQQGRPLRCLTRKPTYLQPRVGESTEVVQGDVLDRESLANALKGVHTAYYLVHSMGALGSFEEKDRQGATNFAEAARKAGVSRIIYLGGLGSDHEELSAHLRSRHEVGEILRTSGALVIELRASIVIGSGSLSFEMIRSLTERLPVMITPRWVNVPAQPIAINDLIDYLLAAADIDLDESRIVEVGGADRVSYGEIMRVYARCRGMKVRMIPVPLLTPYLSSLWLGLVTPLYARIGRRLVESIVHSTVVQDDSAKIFGIEPMGVESAIQQALTNEDQEFAATRWSDSLSSSGELKSWTNTRFKTRLVDARHKDVDVPPSEAFAPIRRIGGDTGWYAWNSLWWLRGVLDMLVGGIGMRRGRANPDELHVGATLDCWRVEVFEPGSRLRLAAEMKLPGRAWLEFEVTPREGGRKSTISQTAIFDPVGPFGRLYWYSVWPLHHLVFGGMIRGIARRACEASGDRENPS